MQGIWFTAKGVTKFRDEPDPVCAEDTVLLRTLYSGLSNGTERNKLMAGNYHSGKWPDRIGYQHVSEVIECGRHIERFQVGDTVFTGTYPGHVPFYVARERDLINKLPEGLVRPSTALLGVASVSFCNVRRAQVTSQDRVLVVGLGLIGLFVAQACVLQGAEVVAVDRNDDRLELARRIGVQETVNNSDGAAWAQLAGGDKFSQCLECSGADILDDIIGTSWGTGLLKRDAQLSLVAGRFDVQFKFNAAGGTHLRLLFSSHFTQADLQHVVELVHSGQIDPDVFVRDIVPSAQAPAMYDVLRDEKQKLLGTIFDWQAESATR